MNRATIPRLAPEPPFIGQFTAIERPIKYTLSNPSTVAKFRACYEQASLFFLAG